MDSGHMERPRGSASDVAPSEITVICAWCELVLTSGGTMISHGICLSCAAQYFVELRPRLADGRLTVGSQDDAIGIAPQSMLMAPESVI